MIQKQSSEIVPVVHETNISPSKNQNLDISKKSEAVVVNTTKSAVVVKQIPKTKVPRNNKPGAKRQIKKSYAIKSMDKSKATKLKEYLSLQIGIYSNKKNAIKQKKYLEAISHLPIQIEEGDLRGENVYRVFLGKFDSTTEAKRCKYKLQKKFKIKSVVK